MLAGSNNVIFGVNLTKNDAQTNNGQFPPNHVWGTIRTIFLGACTHLELAVGSQVFVRFDGSVGYGEERCVSRIFFFEGLT